MVEDIGYLIFAQLLGMTQYPGSPFTGNMFRDIILFLIVPTIFIIMVVYMMTIRIFPPEYKRLSLLLGVGAYLFIIASGYYSAFALLAGPYFIFLIFILGLLYFFLHHFSPRRSALGERPGEQPGRFSGGLFRTGTLNPLARRELEDEYVATLQALALVKGRADKPKEAQQLAMDKIRLEIEIFGKKLSNHEIKKRYGIDLD